MAFDHYDDIGGPSMEELIAEAIDNSDSLEVAELIAGAYDAITKAIRLVGEGDLRDAVKQMRWARAHITDIYVFDSDDPRQNGWVDDRGRP